VRRGALARGGPGGQVVGMGGLEDIELLLRVDSAGASHELLDWAREARIGFSVGYDLTETVRAAIVEISDQDWVSALDQDGAERPNGQLVEITDSLDLTRWPTGSRVGRVRSAAAHKQYRDNPVLVTIKVLEAAGRLVSELAGGDGA
jgi:hypothetical protein